MKRSTEMSGRTRWRQVLLPFLLSLFRGALPDQIRYSIPEELAKNSVVGNLAKDLGLSVPDLSARKLRISAEKEYFVVKPESGDLLVSNRIDRDLWEEASVHSGFRYCRRKPTEYFPCNSNCRGYK